jgi:outer membrane immunogenic protein
LKKILLASAAVIVAAMGAAHAADMPVKAPVAAPSLNWTGWYVGLNAGYGWGDPGSHFDWNRLASSSAPLTPNDYNIRTRGFIGGAQAGYNYQINTLLLGIETDIQFGNIKGTVTTPSTFLPFLADFAHLSESQKINWFGTLRGRLGFLPMSNLLLYGTGGLAYGGVKAETDFQYETPPFSHYQGSTSKTKTGWTVGGGAEWALNRAWSVKAEYLYYDLGTISVTGSQPGNTGFFTLVDQKVTGSIARLGLNYKLGQ